MKGTGFQSAVSRSYGTQNKYRAITTLFLGLLTGNFNAYAQSQIQTDAGNLSAYGGIRLPVTDDEQVYWGRAYKSQDNHFLIEYKLSKNSIAYKILDFSSSISGDKNSDYLYGPDNKSGLEIIRPDSVLTLPNGNVVNTVINNQSGFCPWPYSANFSLSSPEKELWRKSVFIKTAKQNIWKLPKYCSVENTRIPLKYKNPPVTAFPYNGGFILITYNSPYIIGFSPDGETEFFSNRRDAFLTELPHELQITPDFEDGQPPSEIYRLIHIIEDYIGLSHSK